MSDQDGMKQYVLPAPDFTSIAILEQWKKHWKQQDQPWRTDPEIDAKRQHYLEERRKIVVDARQGIYPFKGIELSRADVEWLLATHDNGHGPVFRYKNQPMPLPKGLDLRGAILRNEDLRALPLAYLQGGIDTGVRWSYTDEQRSATIIHLEGAQLDGAHLEGANLIGANLEKASLKNTYLESARMGGANLHGATLQGIYLEAANLNLLGANLEGATIEMSTFVGVTFREANLNGAKINGSTLEGADFSEARLENADLSHLRMEGASFVQVCLGRADLRRASFDHNTNFEGARFSDKNGIGPQVGDVHWGDVDLTVIDWSLVKILKDEYDANNPTNFYDSRKDNLTRIKEYQIAVRAYRQLSVVLRNQGFNEEAARFAYRSQVMQRIVFKRQRKIGQFLFSGLLALLSGYGYKPWRSFRAYLIVILAFAITYFMIGHAVGPALSPLGSLVLSMTPFHGRGFFPGGITLDDPLTVVAALEAFIGLLIEVTFIATLTRRLFGP